MKRRELLARTALAVVPLSLGAAPLLAAIQAGSSSRNRDLEGITVEGREVTLSAASVQELADSIRGDVLLPGAPAYESARQLLNPSFDKYPALVVQPLGAADVSQAVQFAADSNLLLAVKCGGHSASGKSTCNGGMQLDLSRLRGVRVDPVNQTAWVYGGSLLVELDHEAMAHGLVTTAGTVSHTGVGGLTLGGGFGRLARKFGLTIDNLISVDIVTADGRILRASADQNPDLFWAVRGGGGNFGVVTAFEFKLHPMQRQVIAGSYVFPYDQAQQVMEFFGEYAAEAPDELHVGGGIAARPGAPQAASINIVYCGDPTRAEQLLAPIEKAGTLVSKNVTSWDYLALQKSGDIDDPRANGNYMKSAFVTQMTPALAKDLTENFRGNPRRATWVSFQQSGGAINRVPENATAFAHRNIGHNMLSFIAWPAGTDPQEHIAYIKTHWRSVEKYTNGFYHNDTFDEDNSKVNRNYRGNYARLTAIKRQYDPDNLFYLNANIEPGLVAT